jgi:hypothetical protein
MTKALLVSCRPLLALAIYLACHLPAIAGPMSKVKHPNLLLNREEIEQAKAKIDAYPWTAALLERLKAMTKDRKGTYSVAVDPRGDTLYVTWNISRGSKAWDCCGLTAIHIPESER